MYLIVFMHVLQCCLLGVQSCPSLCTCVYQEGSIGTGLRSVLCSDPSMSVIPIAAPADTAKMRLEKTSISTVPRAAFPSLSQLRYLWLTSNAITTIHPSGFLNLTALHELRLDGNLLSAFPWEGLRDTPRLRTLGLHNNRLSSLPGHAALFLANVTYLDLSSNRLTTLPSELLELWLPPPGQLRGPTQRRVLGLHDNVWLCDCPMSVLMALSKSMGSPVVLMDQLLTCSKTADQPGTPFTPADLSQCTRPSVLPSATRVTSTLGTNVMLRCDATGYPTPDLTWSKVAGPAVDNTECSQPPDGTGDSEKLPRKLENFMQDSLRVGSRRSIISLDGISYKDSGDYCCQAQNPAGTVKAFIRLKVVGVIATTPSPKKKTQRGPPKSSLSSRLKPPFSPKSKQTPATTSVPAPTRKTLKLKYMTPPKSTNKTQRTNMSLSSPPTNIKRSRMSLKAKAKDQDTY